MDGVMKFPASKLAAGWALPRDHKALPGRALERAVISVANDCQAVPSIQPLED
jgi:hypothetical protein